VDTKIIHQVAFKQGIVAQALEAVTVRAQAHFGEDTPTPAALESFLAALPVWDKIGMDKEGF
jgi:hypothetical protein